MTNKSTNYLQSAQKAGLSAKAATVYVHLLESGAQSPKSIIHGTKLHRQYVYDALGELKDFGLLEQEGKRRTTHYSATSPDRLLQLIEKKRIDTHDAVANLMRLYDQSPAGVVEVVRGSSAVIESEFALLRAMPEDSPFDIVGGAGMRWVELFHDRIPEWEAIRSEKNIKLRYIGSGEDVTHNREVSIIENESRMIPGIGDIVNVAIRPDSVSFNIYEPEVVAVRVRNQQAVESQRALFEVLWQVAK